MCTAHVFYGNETFLWVCNIMILPLFLDVVEQRISLGWWEKNEISAFPFKFIHVCFILIYLFYLILIQFKNWNIITSHSHFSFLHPALFSYLSWNPSQILCQVDNLFLLLIMYVYVMFYIYIWVNVHAQMHKIQLTESLLMLLLVCIWF